MDAPLPGMTTEDFTVDKPVHVNIPVMSNGTTTDHHARGTCCKCGFFKGAWDSVKGCCCNKTYVKVIDPPLRPVYPQESPERERISSPPVSGSSALSDSSGEDREPQVFVKRIRKGLRRLRKRTGAGLHRVRRFFRGLRERIRRRLRRKHRSSNDSHVLGVRPQISSAVASVSGSSSNYSEQVHDETSVEGRKEREICGERTRKCPFRRLCRKNTEEVKTQEHAKEEKMKGNGSVFKRTWKAVERPFRRCQARVVPIVSDTPVPCSSGLQKTADREQISSERPSVSVPSITESSSLQDKITNKPQEQRAEEPCGRKPLSNAPLLKPSREIYGTIYEEMYTLGEGSFGRVFLARRKSDGQQVAVKYIRKFQNDASDDDDYMTEVKMMSQLQKPPISPYIIQMLEWYDYSDHIKIVMEYPGPCMELQKLIYPDMQTSTKPLKLDEDKIRKIMRQAAQAVKHSLDHGVFHNDVHPGNILVNTKTFNVKLIDFGCARNYTGEPYYKHRYRGACGYWPPEYEFGSSGQFQGNQTNVFQLGKILQEMCSSVGASKECCLLIKACRIINPLKRPTVEEVLNNAWLKTPPLQ